MTPPWRCARTIIHGDVCGTNPLLRYSGYGEVRVIVEDGAVIDPERFAEILKTSDVKELTPPSRLPAIFKIEYAKPVKPKKAVETADSAVESIVELAADVVEPEQYVRIDELVKRDSVLDSDDREYEQALDLPWKELKVA